MRYRLPVLVAALLATFLIAKLSCVVRRYEARELFCEKVMAMQAGSHFEIDFGNGYGD